MKARGRAVRELGRDGLLPGERAGDVVGVAGHREGSLRIDRARRSPDFQYPRFRMQTTVEETGRHTVRLQVEVPPEEFKRDLDRAYRHIAGEVKIPGFRKGKAPRPVIDRAVGRDHVLDHFVRESLPTYYVNALRENDLSPVADPEIDLDDLEEGKPLRFTAVVVVRPRLELEPEQYTGVKVTAPSPEPTERDIDEYLERLRDRQAELDLVSRPAQPGDFVLVDVHATVHGQEIPEATRVGLLAEVGQEAVPPELDKELEGKRAGEIVKVERRPARRLRPARRTGGHPHRARQRGEGEEAAAARRRVRQGRVGVRHAGGAARGPPRASSAS